MTVTAPAPHRPDDAAALDAEREGAGTSIELFTGGGGLALAMHAAGFTHLLLNEYDGRACRTLLDNAAQELDPEQASAELAGKIIEAGRWPLAEGDVHRIGFTPWEGRVDVVAGGVPCQPWSLGGVHRGDEDARNLWPEFARAIRETRPRAFLAENVRGLLRPSFADYWRYTLDTLRAPHLRKRARDDWRGHQDRLRKELAKRRYDSQCRYRVYVLPVNAADYGVPQVRHRVFTLGIREDLGIDWRWPTTRFSQAALLRDQAEGDYWDRHGLTPLPPLSIRVPRSSEVDGKLPWRTIRDALSAEPCLPEPGPDRAETPGWSHHVRWPGARVYPGHTPNDLDRPAKTVKAGVHGVPGGETVLRLGDGTLRYMTVREVARVMTFPDKWRLSGPRGEQMRQLGNAVPVHLGEVMASALARALRPELSSTS